MRLIAVLLIAAFLFLPIASTSAKDPIRDAIVELKDKDGNTFCSAFVINKKIKLLMTADHCVKTVPFVNKVEVEEVFHIPALDVAIIKAPNLGSNQLSLDATERVIKARETVTSYGYANGKSLKTVKQRVMIELLIIPPRDQFMLIAPAIIPGMSGGPVLDVFGKVVSINQMYGEPPSNVALSVPMTIIYPLSRHFWD